MANSIKPPAELKGMGLRLWKILEKHGTQEGNALTLSGKYQGADNTIVESTLFYTTDIGFHTGEPRSVDPSKQFSFGRVVLHDGETIADSSILVKPTGEVSFFLDGTELIKHGGEEGYIEAHKRTSEYITELEEVLSRGVKRGNHPSSRR